MQVTKINWTDMSWNPASGCRKVSPGCKYCYAETLAENKRGTPAFPNGFDPMIRPWKLKEPYREHKKGGRLIFVNSMSDLFLEDFPDEYRDRVFDVIEETPLHRYQILTKRPQVMADYFRDRRPVPPNVWVGTTIESNLYVHRADIIRSISTRSVRFISAEPLLGPLPDLNLAGIDWLITGGESGSHLSTDKLLDARSLARRGGRGEPRWVPNDARTDWVRDLRDRCWNRDTAFWHKQWGGPRPGSSGRKLDGREHDGMPTHVPHAMPGTVAGGMSA